MFLPDCSNFDPKAARTLQPVPSKCLLTLTQLKCNIDFLGGGKMRDCILHSFITATLLCGLFRPLNTVVTVLTENNLVYIWQSPVL